MFSSDAHASRFRTIVIGAVVLASLCLTDAVAQSGIAGCGLGPYTGCIDPVPATYLSGSWIEDDSSSEWTLTANDGGLLTLGDVTGTVLVFPIAPGCPTINYTVAAASSHYSPSGIVNGTEGSTTFQWKAINPTPSGACGGSTPVTSQTFSGTIPNKGNDTGTGTWTNSSGGSGPLAIETNLVLTPTGETLTIDPANSGWGTGIRQAQLQILQTLLDSHTYDPADPHNNKLQGRQVFEASGGTPSDGCYQAAVTGHIPNNPTPSFAIMGSVWNAGWSAGSGNQFGDDGVGWTTGSIDWYRAHLPTSAFPCVAVVPQAMTIVGNISLVGNVQYATHTLKITIEYPHGVIVEKDTALPGNSVSKTSTY